jgi:hypothetical protein
MRVQTLMLLLLVSSNMASKVSRVAGHDAVGLGHEIADAHVAVVGIGQVYQAERALRQLIRLLSEGHADDADVLRRNVRLDERLRSDVWHTLSHGRCRRDDGSVTHYNTLHVFVGRLALLIASTSSESGDLVVVDLVVFGIAGVIADGVTRGGSNITDTVGVGLR